MPVDANIALQVQPVQLPDQVAQYGKLLQLRALQGQGTLQNLQIQNEQQQQSDTQNLRKLFAGAQPGADGNYDLSSLAPQAIAAAPTQAPALLKSIGEMNKQQIDIAKSKTEAALQHLDLQGQLLSGVKDQATYDQARAQAQASGIDVSKIPAQYDPNFVQMTLQRAMSVKDQLTQQHQALTLAETQRNNNFNNQIASKNSNIAQQNANTRQAFDGAGEGGMGGFTPQMGDLLASLASKGVALPAGMRSRQQQVATLGGIINKYPGMSNDDIASQIANGQINFGSDKKAATVAAGQEGKVSTAVNELATFGDQALTASAAVPRGSFIPINQLMQMADSSISDPALLTLKLKLNALNNAYNVLSARGGTDAGSRAHVAQLFASATGDEGVRALVKGLKEEGAAAKSSARDASHMGGADNKSAPTPQSAPAAAIEHLRQNPQLKAQFQAKYGYVPEGL